MRALFLLLALLVAGCAPKSIDSYHTAENEEETVRLLNAREYRKAIWLLESRNGKTPASRETSFLLAQAYLGAAGLEPLKIAADVSAAQSFTSPDARDLFPSCPEAAVGPLKDAEALCLLKRVFLHVPDPDREEMVRARQLFRYAYPDPAASPEWVNVLVGAVETAAVVKRAGRIYLFAKRNLREGQLPPDQDLRWLVIQAKLLLEEGSQALSRADHSGNKVSQLLTGNRGSVWFDRARGAIGWADRLGLGTLFDLLRGNLVSPEDEKRYGAALDRIRSLLEEQEKRLRGE